MSFTQSIMVGFVALRQNPSPSAASGDGIFARPQLSTLQVPAAQAKFVAARQIPPTPWKNYFIA